MGLNCSREEMRKVGKENQIVGRERFELSTSPVLAHFGYQPNALTMLSYRPTQNLDERAFIKSFLNNNRVQLHLMLNVESLFDSYLDHIANLV